MVLGKVRLERVGMLTKGYSGSSGCGDGGECGLEFDAAGGDTGGSGSGLVL